MVDIVMIRTFEQDIIERFAANSRVPVINGLTNEYHPCQIWPTSSLTSSIAAPIRGKTVAWIGDSNNMLQHLAAGGATILDFNAARLDAAGLRSRARARRHLRQQPLRGRSPIRSKRRAAPISLPPTCGPAWASKPRTTSASRTSTTGRSTPK